MELPAMFYGLYRDVKRRTSKIVTRIRKGDDWIALVEAEGFLDTATTPGLIVMRGPSSLLGGAPHFQAWLLWQQIFFANAKVSHVVAEGVFQRSLTRHWGTLGIVGNDHIFWWHPERYRPFLRAVRQYWDVFASAGPRYTNGQQTPAELWALPSSIGHVLARLGIPTETLNAPLPPGGLAALIDRTERHLH